MSLKQKQKKKEIRKKKQIPKESTEHPAGLIDAVLEEICSSQRDQIEGKQSARGRTEKSYNS